jgi:hypothetical protein
MWKPAKPIVIAGYTLSPEETWLREFSFEWFRLAKGQAALEHVADLGIELYPANAHRDPVEVAREEFEKSD